MLCCRLFAVTVSMLVIASVTDASWHSDEELQLPIGRNDNDDSSVHLKLFKFLKALIVKIPKNDDKAGNTLDNTNRSSKGQLLALLKKLQLQKILGTTSSQDDLENSSAAKVARDLLLQAFETFTFLLNNAQENGDNTMTTKKKRVY